MIPCALIGLGRIASLLEDDARREKPATHAGAIDAHPETFIAAGMDSDPERRQSFGERWNIEALYTDAGRMLDEVRPQILHICTHADSHLDYLELGMEHNIPVIILEKPVSDSLRRADRLIRRVEGSASRVVINHERRYSRDYRRAAEVIRSGKYGPLRSVSGRLYMGRDRPVEAILLYDATHLFDVISFLIGGPFSRVRRLHGRRDARTLLAGGECMGVPVFAEIGNGRDHVVFELEFSFEKGRLRIGNGIYEEWESLESPWYEKMRSLLPVDIQRIETTAYFADMFADAVRLLQEPGAVPISGYRAGVESLRLVQKLRHGLARRG